MMDRLGHLVRAVDTEDGEVVLGIVEAEGVAPLRNVEAISELLQLELAKIESEMSETGPPRAEATSVVSLWTRHGNECEGQRSDYRSFAATCRRRKSPPRRETVESRIQ